MSSTRRRAGQALVELAVAAPVLVLILVVPLVAARWAERRLLALSAARDGAWEETVALPARRATPPAGARITVVRRRDLVRATATIAGGPAGTPASRTPVEFLPGPPPLGARFELRVVPPEAGTEATGRAAVRRRWLGGGPARPLRALLRQLLGDEPVRVDFDALPQEDRR